MALGVPILKHFRVSLEDETYVLPRQIHSYLGLDLNSITAELSL